MARLTGLSLNLKCLPPRPSAPHTEDIGEVFISLKLKEHLSQLDRKGQNLILTLRQEQNIPW